MTTPNRPPSCDRLRKELKECPFCGSENVELRDLDEINHYVRCNDCEADGPWHDDNAATKWNSNPRRSEVGELLRLVDASIIGTPTPAEERLLKYADKLRKEWKL